MKKLIALVPLTMALVFGAQALAEGIATGDQVDPAITSGKARKDFRQAREKWLDRRIKNYRMTVTRSCFCAGPFKVKITVRRGKAVKVSDKPWYGPWTIPGMFRIVGQAIKGKAAVLDVKYDQSFGFPKRTWIDYIAMAADDEMGYRITNFKTLKP
jgi:hypothetical protein